ncbi:uncharacterized protein LOC131399924 isoform X2 [Diceros bicornis minor]|uniref:uncharacterized protein LOC131399924 isoform X2 n=1 Tax=Diceros bicornis minor TaxID=77932 RepID=UPI0026E94863|nr:uncharacterized protein LOC131399924 isoform X2 [Diceros bicornis minor]
MVTTCEECKACKSFPEVALSCSPGKMATGDGTQESGPDPSSASPRRALRWFRAAQEALWRVLWGAHQWLRQGRADGSPGTSFPGPGLLCSHPAQGASGPMGSAEQASGQVGGRAAYLLYLSRRRRAGVDDRRSPRGFAVFTTFPELLFIWELVFGGLVWILIASSLVPLPLYQGWVMFVSVFCFIGTTALLVLYIIGAHDGEISWVTLVRVYHHIAALFYIVSSLLEVLAASTMKDTVPREQYLENVFAAVFSCVATLLYTVHMISV